jgi:hypothetical protein
LTCGVVGAVVTTNASPGGYTLIHHSANLDIVCDVETSCDALKALYRFSTMDCAIRRWPDHQNSPKVLVTQPTGSRIYGFRGGSSRSANVCQAEAGVEVKVTPRQSASSPSAARKDVKRLSSDDS